MRQALAKADANPQYVPTTHAIDRANTRFGVASEKVSEWVNGLMEKATHIASSTDNCEVFEYDGIRIVANPVSNTIVTVHHIVKLDFLKPAIEREARRLRREHVRAIRKLELKYAEALREVAEMAVNRARACNPNTRELIAERMAQKQAQASGYVSTIERKESEYQDRLRAMEMIAK